MKRKTIPLLLILSSMMLAGCQGGSSSSLPTSEKSSTFPSAETPSASSSSTDTPKASSSEEPTPSSSSGEEEPSSSSSVVTKEVSVAITASKTTLKLDETLQLTAIVTNATDTSVTWSSSDSAVASVSATGEVTALALGSSAITATSVSDPAKSASVTLTVIDKYDARLTQDGTVTIEAENMDLSGFVIRGDVTSIKPTAQDCIESSDETTYGTSGGKSIGFIGKGSIIKATIYNEKDLKLTPYLRMASADSTFGVDSNITFTIDSTRVDSNGYSTFGSTADNTYYNWKDVELDSLLLAAGEHTLTFTVTGSAINFDAVKLAVSDYDNTSKYNVISQDGTTVTEAEDAILFSGSTFIVRSDAVSVKPTASDCIEASDETTYGTSGGKSVGFIGAGTVISVPLYLKADAVITPEVRMASADSTFNVDGNITFKLDSTTITSNGYNTFGSTADNTYYNWKDVALTTTVLTSGFHTLTFTVTGSAINLDAFKFVTTYYDDVDSYGTQITEDGTTVFEAENLTPTAGSFKVESPTGDAASLTSGGKSTGNYASGTVLNMVFSLKEKANVDIIGVMAKYEDIYSLRDNVKFELDGATLTPDAVTFGHTDTNLYWNWKNVTIASQSLTSGKHTFMVTAIGADNTMPNVDCFKIVTKGMGASFIATNGNTYRVEGESVNTSHLISDGGTSFVESSTEEVAATSGQECLAHVDSGSYFEIPFYVDETSTFLTMTCRLSKYEAINVNDNYSVYVDGTKVAWADTTQTLGRTDGNDWHNWKLCTLSATTLATGTHTFKFSFDNNGANVDYISFAFAAVTEA